MKNKRVASYELRVLGIDPGTATTGWAVIEETAGELKALAFGHISTDKSLSESERILEIKKDLCKILQAYRPHEAAVEKLFFFKNKKTIIQVSQSRGALLLTLEEKNVKVFGYTPLQVKQAMTGYGKADKKQVQLMAKNILKLSAIPKPDDVADAIAVALCHINSRKINQLS